MTDLKRLTLELFDCANPKQAAILQRFFKTGKGEYGWGDKFLGIKVPTQRRIAKKYESLKFNELQTLLNSRYHEHRLVALIILTTKFAKADDKLRKKIFDFYLKNYKNINNWDLVDLSAPNIVGTFLLNRPKKTLFSLAKSNNLWKKRISIVSTHAFIRQGRFKETLEVSQVLINDNHDLIHKAIGWMLREVGKRDKKTLSLFLDKNIKKMSRTTLRYAIEKFPKTERLYYLKK